MSSTIDGLNVDCWLKVFRQLDFSQLLQVRGVSPNWTGIIQDHLLMNVKNFALFGPSPQSHMRSQLPIGRANCGHDEHQIDSSHRIQLTSINSWQEWRDKSNSLIASLTKLFPQLQVLMIDCFGYWLSADQWRILASNCPNLDHLNIMNCSRMDEIIHLSGTNIKHLEMHHSYFYSPEKLETFIGKNPEMDVLVFQGSENLEVNLKFGPNMATKLSSLSLVGSYLGTSFISALSESPCNNITTLKISFVTNKQLKMICLKMSKLTCFEFWSNIIEVRDLGHLSFLTQLTFACTAVRSCNFNQDLSLMTQGCSSLVDLSIKCPFLDDTSVSLVSINCPNLISLRMIECNFRETTNTVFRHLGRLRNLGFLEITHTKIDDGSLLKFMVKMDTLKLISLPNNPRLTEDNLLESPCLEECVVVKICIDGLHSATFKMMKCPNSSYPKRILLIGEVNYEQFNFVLPMPMIPRL